MSLTLEKPVFKINSVLLLFAFGMWIGQDLLMPQRLFGQTTAADYLQKGRTHWVKLEENEAIAALEKALALGLAKPADRIEAHLISAKCWAMKRDQERAKAHFLDILKINPSYELSVTESPVYQEPFRTAKAEFKIPDITPPVISHEPPFELREGNDLFLIANITDDVKVQKAVAFFKGKGAAVFQPVEMQLERPDIFKAIIPAGGLGTAEVAYFIKAEDSSNNAGYWKNESQPNILKITPGIKPIPQIAALPKDNIPPEISYNPPLEIKEGQDFTVSALIKDNRRVKGAEVRFRPKDGSAYQTAAMLQEEAGVFRSLISSNRITPPELYLFIQAQDSAGNVGSWRSAGRPYVLKVSAKPAVRIPPPVSTIAVEKKTGKKGNKTLLWVGLGAVVVGGAVAAAVAGGGGNNGGGGTSTILSDPPAWPTR